MIDFFLRGLCAIYVVAFLSVFVQIPGLYGDDGLEPVSNLLSSWKQQFGGLTDSYELLNKVPTLIWFHDAVGLTAVGAMDACCLVGALAGLIGVIGLHSSVGFAICWACYHSIYIVGQTFLSFQWDILLLEVGFLAVFLARPLPTFGSQKLSSIVPGYAAPFRWLTRFLLFKLMLMAGVVKVQANCPTWLNLTALDYHYATQCIPNPVAWYAHQLPPAIQSWSVAATLLIEIPLTILLLVPIQTVAVIASSLQILLQVLIMATGNYNFFNFLTVLLCCSVMARDNIEFDHTLDRDDAVVDSSLESVGYFLWARHRLRTLEKSREWRAMWVFASLLFTAACGYYMFALGARTKGGTVVSENAPWWLTYHLRLAFTVKQHDELLSRVLPYALGIGFVGLVITCMTYVEDSLRGGGFASKAFRGAWALLVSAAAVAVFSCTLCTFVSIDRSLQGSLPEWPRVIFNEIQTRHVAVSSSYGLFRRMTGVGDSRYDEWKVPVSVVARPEIVLEGSLDGIQFAEIEFKYKPGDLWVAPAVIAPHQPRLDWQMWFAALGSYSHAPWIIHLADKLLEGSPDVISLLDVEKWPWKGAANTTIPPKFIRATTYTYDFTRWNATWVSRLPYKHVVEAGSSGSSPWWFRRDPVSYFPTISKGDASVKTFLSHNGWKRLSSTERQKVSASFDHCNASELCLVSVTTAKWLRSNFHSVLPWIVSTVCVGLFVLPVFACCARRHAEQLREKVKTE